MAQFSVPASVCESAALIQGDGYEETPTKGQQWALPKHFLNDNSSE